MKYSFCEYLSIRPYCTFFKIFRNCVPLTEFNNTTTYDPEKTSHLDPMPAIIMEAGTSSLLLAGPAYPGLITVKQSDGSEIRVRVHGDEFRNYVTRRKATPSPRTRTETGLSQNLTPTDFWSLSVKAKNASRLTDSERKILGTSLRKNLRPLRDDRPANEAKGCADIFIGSRRADAGDCIPPLLGGTTWKPVGNKKVLVLLAEYPDLPFTNGSNEAFDNLLNSKNYTKGGATGSVWQYYYDNSNGQFNQRSCGGRAVQTLQEQGISQGQTGGDGRRSSPSCRQ